MQALEFPVADGSKWWALAFGVQKINLHQAGVSFAPHAASPSSGTADLCFLSPTPLVDWQLHLADQGVDVIDGPVSRSGPQGPIQSLYIRDLDADMLEIYNVE